MLDFAVTLFTLLVLASASTFAHTLVRYLATPQSERSSVYILQSLLLSISIVDITSEVVTAYSHYTVPLELYRPVIYFQVLLFLVYVGGLLSVKANQEVFNIQIPWLHDDNRKRIAFWVFFAFATLLNFLWSITVSAYDHTLLVLLVFPLLGLVGSLVEIANSTKASTAYTLVVITLFIAVMVFKRMWDIYVG